MIELEQHGFAHDRICDALDALARETGLGQPGSQSLPPTAIDGEMLGRWMRAAALERNFEAEPVVVSIPELRAFVEAGVPALVALPATSADATLPMRAATGAASRWLVLCGTRGKRVRVLPGHGPSFEVNAAELERALEEPVLGALPIELERLLEETEPRATRRARARQRLRRELASEQSLGPAFILRPRAGSSFPSQLRRAGVLPRAVALIVAYVLLQASSVAAFWLLGRTALQGRLLGELFPLWAILFAAAVPLQLLANWLSEGITVVASALLKRRLLAGVLALDAEATRTEGLGGLLGRVLESNELEGMGVLGVFRTALGLVQLFAAALVLLAGAGARWTLPLLGISLAATAWLLHRYHSRLLEWTRARLRLTGELVEQMAGYRTRLAQLPRAEWHAGEDERLLAYLRVTERSDGASITPLSTAPRAFLLLGLCLIAPVFVAPAAELQSALAGLAVALGGLLLGEQGFSTLLAGLVPLAAARVAWKSTGPLFHAAEEKERCAPGASLLLPAPSQAPAGESLLAARELLFSYRASASPVVDRVDLTVRAGDRILLEGPSGGGKSTLAALLCGLRAPTAGLLTLRGLDLATLGATEWRHRVAAAPQFHENHVFSAPLAFNLLLGRSWPPSGKDWLDAEEICEALRLAPLLLRMPGGLTQWVGDSGWQLSHGEQSRVFIARTLLQQTDAIVLDESFASLDPENLALALRAVAQRARTLVVIAHP